MTPRQKIQESSKKAIEHGHNNDFQAVKVEVLTIINKLPELKNQVTRAQENLKREEFISEYRTGQDISLTPEQKKVKEKKEDDFENRQTDINEEFKTIAEIKLSCSNILGKIKKFKTLNIIKVGVWIGSGLVGAGSILISFFNKEPKMTQIVLGIFIFIGISNISLYEKMNKIREEVEEKISEGLRVKEELICRIKDYTNINE